MTPQETDEALETDVVWFRWTQVPPPNEEFPLAYECLELLSLLYSVDCDEWLLAIGTMWLRATQRWVNALSPRTFELGVAVHVSEVCKLPRWVERAFVPSACWTSAVDDYTILRRELETVLQGRADTLAEVPAVQVARTQAARRTDSTRNGKSLFRLVDLRGDVFTSHLRREDVASVDELASCGVRVPILDVVYLTMTETTLDLEDMTRLQRLVASSEPHGCALVDGVDICTLSSPQTFDGIFSSIFYSKHIRTIAFDSPNDSGGQPRGCERLMYWLALCAFGRTRSPTLDTVSLCIDLNLTAGGKIILDEYTEQNPPMLSNPGMASRILHYWRPPDNEEDTLVGKKKMKKPKSKA